MTTRKSWSMWKLFVFWCLLALATSTTTRGDGSVEFNGTSSPSFGTSKVQRSTDNVVGSNTVTICVWLYATGQGEGNTGVAVASDASANLKLEHDNSNSTLALIDERDGDTGTWEFSASDNAWSAVAISYNRSTPTIDPTVRVNFASVSTSETSTPSGNPRALGTGYCVGNLPSQGRTWQGRIAHVQVFNRQLSAAEMDACLQAPGSVTNGLRLWLPMTIPLDIHDRSGNAFHGEGTDLATGSSGPALVNPLGAPPRSVVLVNPGSTKINQYLIPRYANGSSHPSAQVKGWGAASMIQGTIYGPSDGTNPQEIVATEDFNVAIDKWINDSSANAPAVCQPELRDLTIAGYDDLGNGYGQGGVVNDQPGLHNPASSYKDREIGAFIQGNRSLVENVRFFHVAGRSCVIQKGFGSLATAVQPADREKVTLRNLWMIRCYAGLDINAIDTIVGNVTCDRIRDYGVRFSAGPAQIDGAMHLYGVSSYPASTGAAPSPAVSFVAGADRCMGGPWYPETSDIGMKIESNQNRLGWIYSHTCPYGNIAIGGTNNIVHDFELAMVDGQTEFNGKPAILIENERNEVRDGYITMPPSSDNPGEVAIRIANYGANHTIQNVRILGSAASGAKGTAIQAQTPLNRCVIIAHFQWLASGIGVDLNYGGSSKLGTGNYIWITTEEAMTTPINFPSGWNNVTPKNTTNKIFINGRQWYPQNDEF